MKKIVFSFIAFVMAIAVAMMVKTDEGNKVFPSWPVSQNVYESEPDNWQKSENVCAGDSVPPRKWHPAEKLV